MFQADQQIGPYTLIRKLGAGSFGEVWVARRNDVQKASEAAIKLFYDSTNLAALEREADVWLKASGHPNVVPVQEFHVYDGQAVVVSEYVDGGDLAHWLVKIGGKAPTIEIAVEIGAGMLAGLSYLHTLTPPVIHCDIKTENILMQQGVPRLADFGIARFRKTAQLSRQFTGTVAYMSPEAFKGDCSPQRDLWAVGVILYLLLCGQLPFPQDNAAEVMASIMTEAAPPLPPSIPAQVRRVVEKALHRDLTQRFASAEEMRSALLGTPLSAYAAAKPSQQRTVDAAGVGGLLPPAQETASAPAGQAYGRALAAGSGQTVDSRAMTPPVRSVTVTSARPVRQEQRKRRYRVFAGLAVLGLLNAGLWTFFRQQPKPTRTVAKAAPVLPPALPAKPVLADTDQEAKRRAALVQEEENRMRAFLAHEKEAARQTAQREWAALQEAKARYAEHARQVAAAQEAYQQQQMYNRPLQGSGNYGGTGVMEQSFIPDAHPSLGGGQSQYPPLSSNTESKGGGVWSGTGHAPSFGGTGGGNSWGGTGGGNSWGGRSSGNGLIMMGTGHSSGGTGGGRSFGGTGRNY